MLIEEKIYMEVVNRLGSGVPTLPRIQIKSVQHILEARTDYPNKVKYKSQVQPGLTIGSFNSKRNTFTVVL